MSYVIKLNMNEEKRESLNEEVAYICTKIIIGASYVPVILLIGTIIQVGFWDMNLGRSICRLIAYVSIVYFIIMITDVFDNWMSLKWEDIEVVDKKKGLGKMMRNSIIQVGMWVFNFIVFGIVLI